MPEISGCDLARHAANRNVLALLCSGHPDADAKVRGADCPYLAKPYQINDLVYASAKAIAHTTENIRRIKAFQAKLETTTEGLKVGLAESDRLMSAGKAILAWFPSPRSVALKRRVKLRRNRAFLGMSFGNGSLI
jgi:hypothetical protein